MVSTECQIISIVKWECSYRSNGHHCKRSSSLNRPLKYGVNTANCGNAKCANDSVMLNVVYRLGIEFLLHNWMHTNQTPDANATYSLVTRFPSYPRSLVLQHV